MDISYEEVYTTNKEEVRRLMFVVSTRRGSTKSVIANL